MLRADGLCDADRRDDLRRMWIDAPESARVGAVPPDGAVSDDEVRNAPAGRASGERNRGRQDLLRDPQRSRVDSHQRRRLDLDDPQGAEAEGDPADGAALGRKPCADGDPTGRRIDAGELARSVERLTGDPDSATAEGDRLDVR